MKLRFPDRITVYTETDTYSHTFSEHIEINDIRTSFRIEDNGLSVKITADDSPLKYVRLRWNFTNKEKRNEPIKILGDCFDRFHADAYWGGIEPERMMPWYMLVSNGSDSVLDTKGRQTEGFGVKVQCNSLVNWQYDESGISMWADIRNGGMGVLLRGRTLDICTVVFGDYKDISAFKAGREFCKKMCPTNTLADHKVYGSNNWYYAYGESSREEILSDTKIVSEQCAGLENIPYMVIDDGWQKHRVEAPWESNEKFGDMKSLASEMKKMGVRPGIWVRYLANTYKEIPEVKPDWCLPRVESGVILDPSNPEVQDYIRRVTKRIIDWGFELIKHDYSSFDFTGAFTYGNQFAKDGWHFYDKTRTTAEIIMDFYRTIKEAAGDNCIILGCNTVSHLCAGMYEVNRTGGDTSGFDWDVTRKMGVNALAFRLMQNGIFYMADADCVGITGAIPWKMNRLWLDILAKSGSPLFVSCKPGVLNDEELEELKEAWKINSIQKNECRPLDWMENKCPARWIIDGKEVYYNWYTEDGVSSFDPNSK